MKPLALAAYGRRRGCSAQAVRQAIVEGRLERSVVMVKGRPKIADPDLADEEWAANTRPRNGGDLPGPEEYDGITFAEARRRKEIELWRQAQIKSEADRLDLEVKRSALVPLADVRAEVIDRYTVVRTRMLSVAARCRQQDPGLSAAQVALIEDCIREGLEELADADS